jgi:PAS domain S-box-containing protein
VPVDISIEFSRLIATLKGRRDKNAVFQKRLCAESAVEFLKHLFSSDFMPHGYCYLWDPWIVWLHVISDGLIALSYYCIPIALVYLVRRRRDLPFNWIFWMFTVFILGCGTTHLMEVWNVWHGSYPLAGIVKAITAVASVATAVLLLPLIPKAIALPSSARLEVVNQELKRQVAERERAEREMQETNARLEHRVEERTAELLESKERMTGIIASAMDAIITVDGRHNIILFNRTAEKIFGWKEKDIVGQPLDCLVPQRLRALHREHVQRFAQTGVTKRTMSKPGILHGRRKNGEEFPMDATISQVDVAGKKLLTVILRDATERQWLEERNARLAAIVEHSENAIYSKDLTGMITSWNKGAELLYGYREEEVLGKSVAMLVPPECRDEIAESLVSLGQGQTVQREETVRRRGGGSPVQLSVLLSPIKDAAGQVVGVSVSAHDISDRKRTEAALREKEQLLSESQRIAHIGSWRFDLNDPAGLRIWSEEMYRIYGVSPDTFTPTAEAVLNLIVPEDRPAIQRWVQACAAGERPGELEFRITRPDGALRFISARGELQLDGESKPTQMAGSGQDITDRKQAEDTLRERARVMDLAQVFVRDMESRVVFWPQGAEKLYGYSAREALGVVSHDLFHTRFPEPLESIEQKLFATGVWEGELVHQKRDGSAIFISSAWILHRDSLGRPVRIVETNVDITANKRAAEDLAVQAEELSCQAAELLSSRQALEAQNLMLESVLDSIQDGLVVADEHGKFILWNPAATRIVGMGAAHISPEEWSAHYGVYLPDTVTPLPTQQNPLVRAMAGEASTAELLFRNTRLDHEVWIESNAAPLRDQNGLVRGGVIAFRDITQKKIQQLEIRKLTEDLEQRIAKRTAQLEAANRELEAFTYSVSHDLRAPLRHIGAFAKIAVEDFGSSMAPEARVHLQHIEDGTRRMTLMVNELLNLARLGRQALNIRPTEMNPLVDQAISVLQPECAGRDVEWRIARMPALECDPILMAQVFQNLLGNALKYSSRRTKAVIEIDCIQKPDQPPIILVRDNGSGFDMKHADKLFAVFQRLHSVEEFEGTGVGLATVHRIIQKHGGSIWAEAEPDRGATFFFTVAEKQLTGTVPKTATAGAQV